MTGPLATLLAATARHVVDEPVRAPDKDFIVLFLARTGSSHLTDLLTSGGVGAPREWLNPGFIGGDDGQASAFGARTFKEYFSRMRSRFSPGGVFGHEMTIDFYDDWSREVRLEDWFPFTVPAVFLFRDNIVEQAISVYFAVVRKLYHRTAETGFDKLPPVPYDEAEIRNCINTFVSQELRLLAFAADKGMQPRFITYEALTQADPKAVVTAVADLVGVTPKLGAVTSPHRKLGDDRNLDYASRFIAANRAFCRELRIRRKPVFDALAAAPLLSV